MTEMKRRTKMESLILPEDLLMEIMLWLPVKSLVRFKCVSKSWLSLLSDPNFALLHFELAAAPTQRLLLLQEGALEMDSVDLNAPSFHDDSVVKFTFPLHRRLPSALKILGSCRGLMLVHRHLNFLCIWNPCTGFQRKIPSPPIYSYANRPSFPFLCGFGYDPSTDDYLVTLAFRIECRTNVVTCMEIFSSRANTWDQLEGSQLEVLNACYCFSIGEPDGLFFNGAIHWFVLKKLEDDEVGEYVIVAFDLKERVFSEFPLPSDLDKFNHFNELRVFGGYLGVCSARYRDSASVVWVMKEYKVQSSWTKSHIVSHDLSIRLSPICLTMSGDIVGINGCRELMKFNDRGEILERHDYYGYPSECSRCGRRKCGCLVRARNVTSIVHTESLLSLPSVN